MSDLYFVPTRTCYMAINWEGAQRIADRYRKRGTKVHVCKLSDHLHVLWPARSQAASCSA